MNFATTPPFDFIFVASHASLTLLLISALIAFGPLLIGAFIKPRYTWPGVASGIGGWLGFFVLVAGISASFDFLKLIIALGEIGFVVAENSTAVLVSAAYTKLPELIAFLGSLLALSMLSFGRSPITLLLAILGLWISGPVSSMLNNYIYSYPIIGVGTSFTFVIIESLYLLISMRVALTYGTSKGEKFIANAKKLVSQ